MKWGSRPRGHLTCLVPTASFLLTGIQVSIYRWNLNVQNSWFCSWTRNGWNCKEKNHNWWTIFQHFLSLMILENMFILHSVLYFFPHGNSVICRKFKWKQACKCIFLNEGCLPSFLTLHNRILTRQIMYDLLSSGFYPKYWYFTFVL